MHIDLNSAFATTEQQARPSLRGKPMGVTNRISRRCCVIAASYEAKALGIKVGVRLDEAKALAPDFIIVESDPPKYHHMYKRLLSIMRDYSPNIEMKSIDEGIIDFHGTEYHNNYRSLEAIGREIKLRVKETIGGWMRINVGIGPNRFLAKQAANWHKPDGLDQIDSRNLKAYYAAHELRDLNGIAQRYEARLHAVGIYSPLDFLAARPDTLRRLVFRSVIGEDWHQRLRGYEVDDQPTKLGMVGRQFVLDIDSRDNAAVLSRFHYLCETTARKLRYRNVDARGVLVWTQLQNGEYWYVRKMHKTQFYTNHDVYQRALALFEQRPTHGRTVAIGVTCYGLNPSRKNQASLLDDINQDAWVTEAIDEINERYGMFTIASAHARGEHQTVKQKVPFGGTEYFRLLLG